MYQKDYWEREGLSKRRPPEHPIVAAYVLPKIDVLSHYVSLTKQTRLLDVGCGNGFFTFYFDKICDVCGVDYSEKMLKMNPVKNKLIMDANELKFEDSSFDIVFSHGLLHHVENIDKIIQEMVRVSKRYVIILDANRNNLLMFLFSLLVKEERKALKFSLTYLGNLAKKNGLRVIASFSHGMMAPNKMPTFFLPLTRWLNFKQPLGTINFIITEKDG